MAKVRTGGSKMTLAALVAAVRTVITKMTGNAKVPTPNPTLVALGALADTAEAKQAAVATKRAELDQAMVERDTAKADLAAAYEQEGAYVQNATGGVEADILSTGYGIRGAPAPVGPMPQVQNFFLTEGDNPGTLDSQWDPVENRSSYEVAVYVGADPATGTFTQAATGTASKALLTGLSSGTRVWAKARAIGSEGPGPWSDPATKIVP